METRGLTQIYTGEGKGKTTAAVGLACRARGHNLKVCYISFHKDHKRWGYGERRVLRKIGVKIYACVKKHPYFHRQAKREEMRADCLKALKLISGLYRRNRYDMLILDEILVAFRSSFLKEDEILNLISSKPLNLELILTGRGASRLIIKNADLVSEIKKIKHPYDAGIKGRKGIEY